MGGGPSCDLNLEAKHYALLIPLHCQGLAPRWAYNAGLGARGLRPCSFRNYLKPHCGECLGIGWKWPGTRPKTFYKEARICTRRKCKTNNENILKNIEQEKEKIDNEQQKSSTENEFENGFNKTHSDQIRDDSRKSSSSTNHKFHPNADKSSSSNNLENSSQKNSTKFLPKNIHREKSQAFLTKNDPYYDEKKNYHEILKEQEYEMYDQKYYEREMPNINEYNEGQIQADNYMDNQNKTNEDDFREIYKNYHLPKNSSTDPFFQNVLPATPKETERNYASGYEGGWSKSPSTPERVIFPQETRQAIRQEFNEMIHNQINPIPVKTHPISPVPSPRMNYECMCHLDINHSPPVPKQTYDICQTDYDWDGTPQDVSSHGYDQCCDEESINYRSSCRGPRLQHLVDLFESIGDGRAPPPPPSTPIEQEKCLYSGSPKKYAVASPEHPRHHKRRRRHKKKSPRTTHKHVPCNERYQCPTQRLEWPVYHRCERCEWLHSRM